MVIRFSLKVLHFNMSTSEECDLTSKDGVNYVESLSYWEGIPPTVDGMLGGFGFISSVDIQGSEQFLKTLFQVRPLDIGKSLNII